MNTYLTNLIKSANFVYNNNITTNKIIRQNGEIIQTGIGDILLIFLLINNNLLSYPLYFNLNIILDNPNKLNNNINFFKFNLQLLSKICANDKIIFYNDKKILYTNKWLSKLSNITNFSVINNYFEFVKPFEYEYIIFHTKCRFTSNYNYANLKQHIKIFCKNFKTNFKIIILGEKKMPNNVEVDIHKITTIYDELLELKSNNDVLDLSVDNIYDNLNFENYCKDMSIIHYAKNNILVGHGGQYCNSIIFGKGMIVYTLPILLGNLNTSNIHNCYIYFDIEDFLKKIDTSYGLSGI